MTRGKSCAIKFSPKTYNCPSDDLLSSHISTCVSFCNVESLSIIFLLKMFQLSTEQYMFSFASKLFFLQYARFFMTKLMSSRYLSALISQSFLDIGSVSRILDGIMKLCVQFCWKIENQENKESPAELEHIAEVLQATYDLLVYWTLHE